MTDPINAISVGTLRDWFAGMALAGLIGVRKEDSSIKLAVDAYRMADAMMDQRRKEVKK